MKRLVIIDGKSLFYRGYYAMGNLSLKDGTPTGGVYGFAAIALEILSKLKPDYVAVAWDKSKTNIRRRREIYPEYKANRKPAPEDFYAQIPMLMELIEVLGWKMFECDDYEADDIIGTLALQADEAGDYDTIMVSSDLDMLQIVDENTRMYALKTGFSKIEEFDVAAVEEKYGISKTQFLDLKALSGDTSDNIPGVPGVGAKGAAKLLQEYGTLDGVYEHVEEVRGALRDKLVAGKESAYMSRELGRIYVDAPVKLSDVPLLVVDGERVISELRKLEFNSLIRRFSGLFGGSAGLSASTSSEPSSARQGQNNIISPYKDFGAPKQANRPKSLYGADVILTGGPKSSEEVDVESPPDVQREPLQRKLPDDIFVSWDVKGEWWREGLVEVPGRCWDLGQGAFLLDPLRDVDMSGDVAAEYWRQRAEFEKLPRLKAVAEEMDMPLIPVLYKMEVAGIGIDREYFAGLAVEFKKDIAEIEQIIYTMAGCEFNINSPLQLAQVLYEKLQLPTAGIKKKTRAYSTGQKELDKLRGLHPIIEEIERIRGVSKLLSTYVEPLPLLADGEGRVHTTFTQNVTATGRLSSVNPNLQNIPVRTEMGRRIREGFVARPGYSFVSADYSQFELRLAAVLAGDQGLIDDFNAGVDIHTKTASDVFGVAMEEVTKEQRRAAKTINFGVLYGMSAKGLSDATDMSVGEAKEFIARYFEVRKPVREYLDSVLRQAKEQGYVETYYGRRKPTQDVKSPNFVVRAGAERAAMNMPIQGTEADLMKRAMIEVDSKMEGLILQIHDSLIVECEDGLVGEVKEILQTVMEGVAPELPVKLDVDVSVGKNWGEI